jgi:hypothetical protein
VARIEAAYDRWDALAAELEAADEGAAGLGGDG